MSWGGIVLSLCYRYCLRLVPILHSALRALQERSDRCQIIVYHLLHVLNTRSSSLKYILFLLLPKWTPRLFSLSEVEDLFLTFAKKASAFNSWFENAEEDLTDPVRCNSLEEIKALREAHDAFRSSLSSAQADFNQLAELDRQIKSFRVASNPYTWFTMEALEETWRNLQKIIKVNRNKALPIATLPLNSSLGHCPSR